MVRCGVVSQREGCGKCDGGSGGGEVNVTGVVVKLRADHNRIRFWNIMILEAPYTGDHRCADLTCG